MTVCGVEHLYDDRTCVLPAGHEADEKGWPIHQSADGYRWESHDELIDETQDVWDRWDEPVDAEPSAGPQVIHLVGTKLPSSSVLFAPSGEVTFSTTVTIT